jgi:hypothetical protein
VNPTWLQRPDVVAKRKATWAMLNSSGGFAMDRLPYEPLPDWLMTLGGPRPENPAGSRRGASLEGFLLLMDARERTGY